MWTNVGGHTSTLTAAYRVLLVPQILWVVCAFPRAVPQPLKTPALSTVSIVLLSPECQSWNVSRPIPNV